MKTMTMMRTVSPEGAESLCCLNLERGFGYEKTDMDVYGIDTLSCSGTCDDAGVRDAGAGG